MVRVVIVHFTAAVAFFPAAVRSTLFTAPASVSSAPGVRIAFVMDLLVLRARLLINLFFAIGHRYSPLLQWNGYVSPATGVPTDGSNEG